MRIARFARESRPVGVSDIKRAAERMMGQGRYGRSYELLIAVENYPVVAIGHGAYAGPSLQDRAPSPRSGLEATSGRQPPEGGWRGGAGPVAVTL